MEKIVSYIPQLLPYLLITFEYVLLSLIIGILLALILVAAKLSRFRVLKGIAFGYTTVMRCTPSIVLLFLVFYGLPPLLKSVTGIDIENLDAFVYVVVTFSLFLGASLSEVMRSAYLAVDRGQYEAAVCVGLTHWQAFLHIVLPQVFYLMLPNLGNTILFLLKDGALGYTIGFIDLMGKASLINTNTMSAYILEIYLALALIYWVVSIIIEQVFGRLEESFGAGFGRKQTEKKREVA